MAEKILILGMGNTVLCDDAAGILVAREIHRQLQGALSSSVSVEEASYGGWRLVDLLAGYDRAVIIDSVITGKYPLGECFRIEQNAKPLSRLQSSHGLGLFEAIEFAKASGQKMPDKVSVYGIEIKNNTEFGEKVCAEIESKIPIIASEIIAEEKLK